MVIFHCYVSSPEGMHYGFIVGLLGDTMGLLDLYWDYYWGYNGENLPTMDLYWDYWGIPREIYMDLHSSDMNMS